MTGAAPVVRIESMSPSPWRDRAACRGLGADDFYAGTRSEEDRAAIARAVETCRTCPVAVECLGDALAMPVNMRTFGIRAGYYGSALVRLRLPAPRARARLVGDPVGSAGSPSSWVADMAGRSATDTHTGDGWT